MKKHYSIKKTVRVHYQVTANSEEDALKITDEQSPVILLSKMKNASLIELIKEEVKELKF